MRQSKAEIYLHFVWATYCRLPLLSPSIAEAVYRCIQQEAQHLGCDVLAVGGIPDHVHLLVKILTRLAPARLMQQIKGVSSHFTHDRLEECQGFFWQEGYGVFSVGRDQRQAVVAYIANQKQHHAANTTQLSWEETDEEYIPRRTSA